MVYRYWVAGLLFLVTCAGTRATTIYVMKIVVARIGEKHQTQNSKSFRQNFCAVIRCL